MPPPGVLRYKEGDKEGMSSTTREWCREMNDWQKCIGGGLCPTAKKAKKLLVNFQWCAVAANGEFAAHWPGDDADGISQPRDSHSPLAHTSPE